MRKGIGQKLAYVLAIGSILLVWQVGSLFLPEFLLPGVPKTLVRIGTLVTEPEFLDGLKSSLYRLAVGYPIACLVGTALGLIGGISKPFARYLRALISTLQSIPPVTWVPFLVIFFGFGDTPIITVITIASFFPMALSVLNATEGVNKTHLELARVLGANRFQLLRKVYLPESFPAFITGAQVSFGNAWRSLIAAEMVGGARAGLGWSMRYAGEIADMKGVLALILVIGAISAILDHFVLEQLKRRLLRYRFVTGEGR
ncbi:MAG TPA: ABC transporter permease [Symbiobacteriaceae bacterium]|nr:ABC transporter permease [Symbiobacteriaceae bacterium]